MSMMGEELMTLVMAADAQAGFVGSFGEDDEDDAWRDDDLDDEDDEDAPSW